MGGGRGSNATTKDDETELGTEANKGNKEIRELGRRGERRNRNSKTTL